MIDDTLSEGSETVQAYLSLVSVSSNASNDTSVEFTVEQTNITIVDSRGKKGRKRVGGRHKIMFRGLCATISLVPPPTT